MAAIICTLKIRTKLPGRTVDSDLANCTILSRSQYIETLANNPWSRGGGSYIF